MNQKTYTVIDTDTNQPVASGLSAWDAYIKTSDYEAANIIDEETNQSVDACELGFEL